METVLKCLMNSLKMFKLGISTVTSASQDECIPVQVRINHVVSVIDSSFSIKTG